MKLIARVAIRHEKWNHRIRIVIGEWKYLSNMYSSNILHDVDVFEYVTGVVMDGHDFHNIFCWYAFARCLKHAARLILTNDYRSTITHEYYGNASLLSSANRYFENNIFQVYYFKNTYVYQTIITKSSNHFSYVICLKKNNSTASSGSATPL